MKIKETDIRNVPLAELLDRICTVFQRVYLFQDTIYNNIMGKPDATKEEVYEAAKKFVATISLWHFPRGSK